MATIRARYENGVLTPLQPLDLEEGSEVEVYVPAEEQPQQPAGMNNAPPQDSVTADTKTDPGPSTGHGEDIDLDNPPPNVNPTLWWIANLHKKYPPGSFDHLPTDMSINVDHYAYGVPKRTEEITDEE